MSEPLEISFVGEGAEIAERAARAQPDRGPDRVPGQKIEPGPASPGAKGTPSRSRPRTGSRSPPAPTVRTSMKRTSRSGSRPGDRYSRPGDVDVARRQRESEGDWLGSRGRGRPGARRPRRRRRPEGKRAAVRSERRAKSEPRRGEQARNDGRTAGPGGKGEGRGRGDARGRGRPSGKGTGRGWSLEARPAGGQGALAVEGVEQEVAEDPDPQGDGPLVRVEVRAVEGRPPPGPGS